MPRTRNPVDPEALAKAIAAYRAGQTSYDVAPILGVHQTMACRILKRAGVEMRPRGRRKNAERNREIARRYFAGETGAALAEEFGLSTPRISAIAHADD